MSDEQCIFEEVSPNGNVLATVTKYERVVFFYLQGAQETEFGLKACWVRNLDVAPSTLDVIAMRQGNPPMLPTTHCRHPKGASPPRKKDLRVVWFEEGDAAALLERDEVLAIIPGWSGTNGFDGHARDCIGESPLCWELKRDNVLFDRVRRSEDYWAMWDEKPSPWKQIQEGQSEAYEEQIGKHEKYFAIDGGKWPPKAMLKIVRDDAVVMVTVGVCMRAQPSVEMYSQTPESLRRVEFGIALSSELADAGFRSVASYLSAQTGLPWSQYTWLGPHHTLACDAFGPTSPFTSMLLVPQPRGAPTVDLPKFLGDPVNLLWLVAITEDELSFAMRTPTGGSDLSKKLTAAGHGWICRNRRSVA